MNPKAQAFVERAKACTAEIDKLQMSEPGIYVLALLLNRATHIAQLLCAADPSAKTDVRSMFLDSMMNCDQPPPAPPKVYCAEGQHVSSAKQ